MTACGTAVLARAVLATMTLAEAADFLYPPVSRDQLARIAAQLPGLRPVGHRATGGRPLPVYDAVEIMDLHNVLRRWL